MHRTRLFTWTGTAVAASVALAAFFYLPTRQSIVEAATILRSFRETLHHALELRMEKLCVEGLHIDGDVLLQFKQPVTMQQLFGEQNDIENHLSGVYADLHVHAAENAAEADVAGLDVDTRLALAPQNKWVFVNLRALPTQLLEEEPAVVIVSTLLRGGLLIELDGILQDSELFGGEDDEDEHAGASRAKKQVNVNAAAAANPNAPGADASNKPGAAQKYSNVEIRLGDDLQDESKIAALLASLLSGQADAGQLASLVTEIEKHARTVAVTEVAPGVHLLSMSGFKPDGDAADEAWVAKMTVEMRYREGAGVESLICRNVGEEEGTVRLAFIDTTPDLSRFDKQRLIDQGVRRLDADALAKMVGSIGGSDDDDRDQK